MHVVRGLKAMEATTGKRPHILFVPYPAQGHVALLMKLSIQITAYGIKVTIVKKVDSCTTPGLTIAWPLEASKMMGIASVAVWPAGPGTLALGFHIAKLIVDGIMDTDGNSKSCESIQLSEDIPAWKHNELGWSFPDWLGKRVAGSVVYVAFGSTAILGQLQLEELAMGLELIGNHFLWVVRSDLVNGMHSKFKEEFTDRIANGGKTVHWAPQKNVLAHHSVACFSSHCGWNSTMEGLSMGVPFLCWPYFADQFHNKSCICETWKIGLASEKDENGIITRQEINAKVTLRLGYKGKCDAFEGNC